MKNIILTWLGVVGCALVTWGADNPCIESGPHYGTWSCVQPATSYSAGFLSHTSAVVRVGEGILAPTAYGVTFSGGLKRAYVSYDCPNNPSGYVTNTLSYFPESAYLAPTPPSVFTNTGTFTYSVVVIGKPQDGLCADVTNTVGQFTVKVFTTDDCDYDGFNDYEESLMGTDPCNPDDIRSTWLAYWRFDTTNWLGESGQTAITATNLQLSSGRNGNSVLIDHSSATRLSYREIETNGMANILLRQGTLRFWFRPQWSSVNQPGGTGPGTNARLIELGSESVGAPSGWWALVLNSNGTQLSFITQTNGAGRTNLTANISWKSSDWHQICLTYSKTNTSLFIDGSPVVTNGAGVVHYPQALLRAMGMRIGSDQNGARLAKGRFDDLETYTVPLSAASIQSSYIPPGQSLITNTCCVRPITLSYSSVSNMAVGTTNTVALGYAPGNFGWLTWSNRFTPKELAENLTNQPCGVYIHSENPGDRTISVGDLLQGETGVINSSHVQAAITNLITNLVHIYVPVWGSLGGTGNGLKYRVTNFAEIQIIACDLPSKTLKFVFYGLSSCTSAANTPPLVNAGPNEVIPLGAVLTLKGSISDDGLPSNTLTSLWSKLSGPGTVSFGTPTLTNSTATFSTYGVYDLQLRAGDGQLISSDDVFITVNSPPSVSITNPTNGKLFVTSPTNILLEATAADPDGSVIKVEFFQGATKVGEDVQAPFNMLWSSVGGGVYNFKAVATDNYGLSTTSAVVSVTVNFMPSVWITSPSNHQLFAVSPTNITIQASASDPDGNATIAKVEFFANGSKLGEDLAAPFAWTWANAALGTNVLSARVTDNRGATAISTNISIVVNFMPNVWLTYPTNNQQFQKIPTNIILQAAATDGDGLSTIVKVEFFTNGFKLGEDLNSPFTFTWNNASPGTNTLRARVTDNRGATAFSSNITISVSYLPTVAVTYPTNGQTFLAPTNMTVTATAQTPSGTIDYVEIFVGTNRLGVATTAPYNVVWNPVLGGNYNITARAVDSRGLVATSSVVTISVRKPPIVTITNPPDNTIQGPAPMNFAVGATAVADAATITNVVFFVGTNLLGSDAVAPYGVPWTSVPAGTYTLVAKATDNLGASGVSRPVTVTVRPVNQPPIVNPGPNQTTRMPTASPLFGTVSDDGLPDGIPLLTHWSKVSGPGNVTFGNSNSPATTVNFTAAGTYVLKLTASDSVFTVSSNMTVTVLAPNLPPVVNAGSNQVISLAARYQITNSALNGTLQQSSRGSRGKDFWVGFPQNHTDDGPALNLSLFIASESNTRGSVSVPGIGFFTNFNVTAGQITTIVVPESAEVEGSDIVSEQGVHVRAEAEVSVYGLTERQYTSDAFLALPVNSIGTNYVVLAWSGGMSSQLLIVGTAKDTVVTITPSVSDVTWNRTGGQAFTTNLNQGQTYQLQSSAGDLSGTIISANKPVAVFGGNRCANVPVGYYACDTIVEQLPATNSWGKEFFTVPLATRSFGDTFQLVASANQTTVRTNGVIMVANLNKGAAYQFLLATNCKVTADKPILLAQFANGQEYDGTIADPFMMLIPPYEQFLSDYTITPATNNIATNFINIVATNAAIGQIFFDGAAIPSTKFAAIGNSGYSGVQLPILPTTHRLTSAYPFGVFIYGFGDYESYGYPGGLSLGAITEVASILISPRSVTNAVGTTCFFTAGVSNQNNQPIAGVRVDFQVTGSNSFTGVSFTDESGQARFYYTGTNSGKDTIRASIGAFSAFATNTWDLPFFTLRGQVSDDGLPIGVTNSLWTQRGGPSIVNFVGANTTSSVVRVTEEGFYVFRLTGDDTQMTNYDEVTITVQRNQAPFVDVGSNLVTKASSIPLNGSVSDDGLPHGSLKINWAKVSGPGVVTFANPSNAFTAATFSTPGVYILRLTGDDAQAVVSADLKVTIQVDPQPVQCGQTVSGTLASTARRSMLEGNGFADYYVFSGSSNQILVVTLTSTNFDAFVSIRNSGLELLADCDDAGGTTNAQIIYVLPATGDYLIEATSSGTNKTGAYSLQVGCGLAPIVKLTNPPNNSVFTNVPASISLAATATDGDGVERVEFYASGTYLTTLYSTPYSYSWTGVGAGNYTLTAVAYDGLGNAATSSPVAIVVGKPTMVLNPTSSCSSLVGTLASVNATLKSGSGVPIANASVSFSVSGANLTNRTVVTDASGVASFSYLGTNFGRDQVIASAIVSGQPVTAAGIEKNWARSIACSQIIAGNLSSSDGASSRAGYADYFSILGQAGDTVTLTLRAPSFDAFLSLLDLNCNVITNSDDFNGTTDSQIVVTLPVTGNYLIEVTSALPLKTGAYNLKYECGSVAGLPEIAVYKGNQEVLNYGTIDLGVLPVGASTNITLVISNVGTGELNLGTIGLSSDFTMSVLPTNPVVAGGWTSCTIQFNAITNSVKSGTLSLVNNDMDNGDGFENPFVINLVAAGNIPGTPPTVVITTPQNNSLFGYGQAIPFVATATAATGNISKVEFFVTTSVGRILLGRAVSAPYSLSWLEPEPGIHNVYAVATDNAGRIGTSLPVTVQVQTPDNNRAPIANRDEKAVLMNSANNVIDVLLNDSDPDGDEFTVVGIGDLSKVPGTASIINNGKAISFSPFSNTAGGGWFLYWIADSRGRKATNVVSVSIPVPQLPTVSIVNPTSGQSFTPGASVTITANVNVAVGAVGEVEFVLDERVIKKLTNAPYSFNWTATAGSHELYAVLTDSFGQQDYSGTVSFTVVPNPNDNPPKAIIASPAPATELVDGLTVLHRPIIREGLFTMTGEATDPDNDPVSYQINLYLPDGTFVANLTSGPLGPDGFRSGAVTAGGILGTNDFTRFANGVYELELVVRAAFRDSRTSVEIELQSELKIGHFSFSQQDVAIPVSGVPLTIVRSYNSLNPHLGDFGVGWTFVLNDMNVALNDFRDDVEDLDYEVFSQRVGGGWDVTLTLPDGRRTTFYFTPDSDRFGNYFANWTPPQNISGYTLEAQGPSTLAGILGIAGGDAYWQDYETGAGVPMDVFDFRGWVLTAPDGTEYYIGREDLGVHNVDDGGLGYAVHAWGKPSLNKIVQRSGDTILISRDGIRHLNHTNGTTRQVVIHRNGDGLISAISDPNGLDANGVTNGPPAVKYEYDSNKNLIQVQQLISRSPESYLTNTFAYTNKAHPHFITSITDGRGLQVAKNFYDDNGRLIAVADAEGRLTRFVHSVSNNIEIVIDRSGATNTYAYDSRGNVVAMTNALGVVVLMSYNANNKLLAQTNAFGTPYQTWNLYTYDENGNRKAVVDSLNHTNSYVYDSYGNLLTSMDPIGNVTTNGYDSTGHQTNMVRLDSQGQVIELASSKYVGNYLVETRNGSNQVTAAFVYDALGNLTNMTDASGMSRRYEYDKNGNQTASAYTWTPPGGLPVTVTTTTVYDALGRVLRSVDGDGNTNYVTYNAIGKPESTVDKFGNTNIYLYDVRGNLIQTTFANNSVSRTVYDEMGRPVVAVGINQGIGTRTDYDALGRVTNVTKLLNTRVDVIPEPNAPGFWKSVVVQAGTGIATNITKYFENGWVKSRTGFDGATTTYDYWPDGQLRTVTDALTNVTYFEYDPAGRQKLVKDALNRTNTFQYDGVGRLVVTKFSDNSYISNYFNLSGEKILERDQSGLTTQFAYGTNGHLESVTKPQVPDPENNNQLVSPVWGYQYDSYGRLVAIKDPKGRTNVFTYDALGRQLTRRLQSGATETNIYNSKGQVWKKLDFKGQKTEIVYDNFGRPRAKFYFGVGSNAPSEAVCYEYNSKGLLSKIVERSGPGVTTNVCDGYSVLVGIKNETQTWHAGAWASLARYLTVLYGVLGICIVLLAPWYLPGPVLKALFMFLKGGFLLKSESPIRRARVRLPHLMWRVVTFVLIISLLGSDEKLYLSLNAQAQCTFPSNFSTEYERITKFDYDIEGRLSQVNCPEGVINYGYDLATGRHTSTCTENSEVAYGYDALGRLKTVTVFKRNGVAVTPPEVTTYTYTKVGSRETITYPNNIVSTYSYDSLNRLTNLTHQLGTTNIGRYSYQLHSSGRRTNALEVLRLENGTYMTNQLSWAYDGLYRLTNEVAVSSSAAGQYSIAYGYDLVGNRLKRLRQVGNAVETINSVFNSNDQLLREEVSTLNSTLTTNSYAYDANGALIGKTNGAQVVAYTYNLGNRLSGVIANGVTTKYLYNEQGILVKSSTGSTVKNYLIDQNNPTGYAQVIEELDGLGNSPRFSYTIGSDLLGQCGVVTTAPSYFLADGHGSTRQVVTKTGGVTSRYNYDAYGVLLGSSSPTPETEVRYAGEHFDSNAGMYYLRARHYDPANGRFNQLDSFKGDNFDPQSLHKYAYCVNDPGNRLDPSGLISMVEIMVVAGIAGFLASTLVTYIRTGDILKSLTAGIIGGLLSAGIAAGITVLAIGISFVLITYFGIVLSASLIAGVIGLGLLAFQAYGAIQDIQNAQNGREEAAAYTELALIVIFAMLTLGTVRVSLRSNAAARDYYLGQKAQLKQLQAEWKAQNLPLEQQARNAHAHRKAARLATRDMMFFEPDVTALRLRDTQKYGDPDGPTFESLYEKGIKMGLSPEETYQSILNGSLETMSAADRISTGGGQSNK